MCQMAQFLGQCCYSEEGSTGFDKATLSSEAKRHIEVLCTPANAAKCYQRARDVGAAHGFFSVECDACLGLGKVRLSYTFNTVPINCRLETPGCINPQHPTINPQPSTLNPQPSTLNPQPSTLNPEPSAFSPNPQPSTLNPQQLTIKEGRHEEGLELLRNALAGHDAFAKPSSQAPPPF